MRSATAYLRSRLRPEVAVAVGPDRFVVDLRDPEIGRTVYLQGRYDDHLIKLAAQLDLAGKVCVDVGANLGLYAIPLSRMVGPTGSVLAFEPEQRNFDLLTRNRELNAATNLTCLRRAAGAMGGHCTLAVNPYNWGDHWIADAPAPSWATTQTVEQVTLDDALDDVSPGRLAFMKMDVQGQELAVLQGMRRVVERHPDLVLQIEISPTHLRNAGTSATAVVEHLLSLGFQGWDVAPHRIVPVQSAPTYELMSDLHWADLLLSRNPDLVWKMLQPAYGSVGQT